MKTYPYLAAGVFLKATSLLNDTYFEGTVIFIAEYNDQGALGYVMNNPYPRRFNELVEFSGSPAFTLYEGGPVEHEKLFILHRRPDLISDSVLIANDIYSGGHFKQAVRMMNNQRLTDTDFRLFIGYCGWNRGDLEAEIAEGSWEVVEGEVFR